MARDYGRDARDWDYPGDGGHAYGRGREEGGYGRGYWSNVDREYGGRDVGGRDFDRGYGGSGGGGRGRYREFADQWRAQGDQWREYEQHEHGRDYPRRASGPGGGYGGDYAGERGYGEGRALGDYDRSRAEVRDYRGDRGDIEGREDVDRGDRGAGRYGRYGNQQRYDFTGRSWHAGPEHWEAEGPGPNAFQARGGTGGGPGGGRSGGTSEWRGGFGREGYVGGSGGGYGHGGALEYGRGGMDVGGRDQDWGIGDTRHGRGGVGGRGNWFEGRGPVTFGGAESGTSGWGDVDFPEGNRDAQSYGGGRRGFAGVGPRNYRRSDERIQEEVCEALTRHPGIDASDIDIRVEGGEVTLSGEVEDRRAKRLAEEIAESCAGVSDVHNELKARRGLLGGLTGNQDREVSRSTTRETTSGATGSAGATSGATGTTGGTTGTGGSTRGRRGAGAGSSSQDATQTALRADAGTPDERIGSGTGTGQTNSGGLPGNASPTGTGTR